MTRHFWHTQLFHPAAGLHNRHIQTILSNALRTDHGIAFRRHRLTTPDGDFLDLDFADVDPSFRIESPGSTPLVLLLHGLEGSARRGYACESYRQLARRGIGSVGMNFRSCSGEINRTARFYHAGATGDVITVFNHLEQIFPAVPKAIIGFSLGANLLLKLLGEWGADAPPSLRAAVAISPPFDMVKNSQVLTRGWGFWYGRRFLVSLLQKVAAKQDLLRERLDLEQVFQARNLVEFDQFGTAPLNGFLDAEDYYRRNSCGRFLDTIKRPTLIIRAQDDPLMDPTDIPYHAVSANPYLLAHFPRYGGHVGFLAGGWRQGFSFWAEAQAADFIARHLTAPAAAGLPGERAATTEK